MVEKVKDKPGREEVPGVGRDIGRDPREMAPAEFETLGHSRISLSRAIRLRCLDCCAGSPPEVRYCPAVACPSWPFRMGTNPWRVKRTLTDEQKAKLMSRGGAFVSKKEIPPAAVTSAQKKTTKVNPPVAKPSAQAPSTVRVPSTDPAVKESDRLEGGAGGGFADPLNVAPGQTITIEVGNVGAGGSASGNSVSDRIARGEAVNLGKVAAGVSVTPALLVEMDEHDKNAKTDYSAMSPAQMRIMEASQRRLDRGDVNYERIAEKISGPIQGEDAPRGPRKKGVVEIIEMGPSLSAEETGVLEEDDDPYAPLAAMRAASNEIEKMNMPVAGPTLQTCNRCGAQRMTGMPDGCHAKVRQIGCPFMPPDPPEE